MRNQVLVGLLSGLIATSAFGTEWTYIGTTSDNLSLFAYERNGIRKSHEGILVWVAEINSNSKLPYDLTLQIFTFDCDRFRFRNEQTSFYLRGKVKRQIDGDIKWAFATPGSIGEGLVNGACNRFTSDYVFRSNDWKGLTLWGKNLLKRAMKASESSF